MELTTPHSLERVALMAEAKSHGQLFCATGGSHVTSDNFFKAMEVPIRKKQIKEMEEDKKRRQYFAKCLLEGQAVLDQNKSDNQFSSLELEKILLMHHVPKKDMGSKRDKLQMWMDIKATMKPPPIFSPWDEKDEAKLDDLRKMQIKLEDTALGRQTTIEQLKVNASIDKMDLNKLSALEEKVQRAKRIKLDLGTETKISANNPIDRDKKFKSSGCKASDDEVEGAA